MALNETVTITYTLKNHETDVAANIAQKVALSNDNEEYFEASYKIDDNTIAANGTGTVTVTVRLKKTPVVEDYNTANIGFTVEATAADNKTVYSNVAENGPFENFCASAALAKAYLAYNDEDEVFANWCLRSAKEDFEFANNLYVTNASDVVTGT